MNRKWIRKILNIVNVVRYRRYIDRNTIKVAIYDNCLEITSPGKLPLGQAIDKLKQGNSNIRNEALAYILWYLKYIEIWGHGIPKIIQSCKIAGLKEPTFISGETELVASIFRDINFENEALNVNEEKIISIIKENPSIKQKEIIDKSGLSCAHVQRIMKKLQENVE